MTVKIEWATDNIDSRIAWMARVSNSKANPGDPHEKLIAYLINNRHWSPLEMSNICFEIETTRDIGRQLLRHRSLHFQELSQRYAKIEQEKPVICTARLQDHKNRQNSIPMDEDIFSWEETQNVVWAQAYDAYQYAIECGLAKEVARKLLPEGLTQTRMFVNGTVRDWYHYLSVRLDKSTQLEHRELAEEIYAKCMEIAPATFAHLKYEEST